MKRVELSKTVVTLASLLFALLPGAVFADTFQSTNYTIDAGVTGDSVSGPQSSTSYKLESSGGQSVIGNGTGGSYVLGEGYVPQLDQSLQLIVVPGLVTANYPFDEGSGLYAQNYHGPSDIPLDAVGTPSWNTGKFGSSIVTSSGNYMESRASSPFSDNNLLVCAWSRISSTGTEPTIAAQADSTLSTANMWSLGWNTSDTKIQAKVNVGGTVYTATSSTSASLNTWVHACIAYSGSQVRVYQNGVVSSTSASGTYSSPSTKLTVGARSGGGQVLDGRVDELRVYSNPLTAAKVLNEYTAQNSGVPAALSLNTVTPGVSETYNVGMTILSDAFDYQIGVSQDHDLQQGAYTISPVSGSIASPVTWSEGSTKGLGFTITSINPGGEPPIWNSGNDYAALPNSTTTFLSRQRSDGTRVAVIMKLRLDVPVTQEAGDYSNTATWAGTITP